MLGVKYDTIGVGLYFIDILKGASSSKVWCSELTALCMHRAIRYKDSNAILDVADTLIMPNQMRLDFKEYESTKEILDADVQRFSPNKRLSEIDVYGRVAI
jgi:hypothetical protein